MISLGKLFERREEIHNNNHCEEGVHVEQSSVVLTVKSGEKESKGHSALYSGWTT